jgi:hypothetical protein
MHTRHHSIGLIDCGRVTRLTRGFANLFAYEGGFPPFDRTYVIWP